MDKFKNVDAVILDVDGTLWDSTPIVAKAWTRAVQENGCNMTVTADMLKQLFGRTMKLIADLMLPHIEEKKRYEILDVCCEYEHQALEEDECNICYPGVKETIIKLSEHLPVCIVSNCQSGYIELFLEKTGLAPYVTDFECYGNTGKSKGENIQLVVERNHYVTPIYVGDTEGDRTAAEAAGMPFIYASYGFGKPGRADYVIQQFDELLQLITK